MWSGPQVDNGQHKSTNRLLVLVPHERPHGIMRILENPCMLLPKALKMRAIKDTMHQDNHGCLWPNHSKCGTQPTWAKMQRRKPVSHARLSNRRSFESFAAKPNHSLNFSLSLSKDDWQPIIGYPHGRSYMMNFRLSAGQNVIFHMYMQPNHYLSRRLRSVRVRASERERGREREREIHYVR